MPLSNSAILSLNEITTQIPDKKSLTEKDEQLIRNTFTRILQNGDWYDVDEIQSWFENEGTWIHRPVIIRITNMSHYVQTKFQQRPAKLKMLSEQDDCGCD